MKQSRFFLSVVLLTLLLTACGGEEPLPAIPTETIVPTTPTDAPLPPTAIVHTIIPGEPVFLLAQLISDCTIGNGVTVGYPIILSSGCDLWEFNKIERPFKDNFLTYFPQSDISRAQIGHNDTWFFAQAITYFGEVVDPQPMNGTYGIELDRNLDGRGDVLVLASQPGEEWDVTGVRVWLDMDVTVGADTPVIADDDNPDGGYDEMIFEAGMGDDPDLAWARISPDDPNIVQIAFKRALGGQSNQEQFSWLMWAGLIDFVPPDFDIVDTYTEIDVYSFDNTCSWTFGTSLQGLPNQCGIQVKVRLPGEDPVPTPLGCYVPRAPDCSGVLTWNAETCHWECEELK